MEMGYISEFIDHLMAPIRRLDSVDELVDFTIANQVRSPRSLLRFRCSHQDIKTSDLNLIQHLV